MTKPKVLIIDDDVAITQQLFWTLCDEFEVMTANNLSSAIRRATIYEPDVAVLDLHLPPTLDAPDTGLRILDYLKSARPARAPRTHATLKRPLRASRVFEPSSDPPGESGRGCPPRGAEGFFDKP